MRAVEASRTGRGTLWVRLSAPFQRPVKTKIKRSVILIGVLEMVCFFSAACLGGRERPIHYYTLNTPAVTTVPAKPDGLVLLVGRIATPGALQDGRIQYRSGNNEVGAYQYHQWSERPGLMVQEFLVQTLRASGKFRQVQEASSAAAGDYLIRGKLDEFDEIEEPPFRSRVSLWLELTDRKTSLVVWDHRYNREEPVDKKTIQEVVASMDHNLQQVIVEAASGIETFLANRN